MFRPWGDNCDRDVEATAYRDTYSRAINNNSTHLPINVPCSTGPFPGGYSSGFSVGMCRFKS